MKETVVEVGASTQDQQPKDAFTPLAAPPHPHRRPRVREVSSRFMSPVVSSSSSGDLHLLAAKSPFPKHAISTPAGLQSRQQLQRSNPVQRLPHQLLEPLCSANQNRPETMRSLETPFGLQSKALQRSHRAMKLFKENGGREEQQQHLDSNASQSKTSDTAKCPGRIAPSRPDTPTLTSVDMLASARLRLTTQPCQPSANIAPTAAVKLLQSSGMSLLAQPQKIGPNTTREATSVFVNPASGDDSNVDKGSAQTLARNPTSIDSRSCTTTTQGITCTSSPFPAHNCKTWSLPDLRSSMPEADMLPIVSTRLQTERNCIRGNISGNESSKLYASPCSRSMNLPLSNCEHSVKTTEKAAYILSKPCKNSMKMEGLYLPPQPPCTKLALDSRKGRKVSSHQEDVHSLRMLHNHYLQWRYANAKAEVSMHSQRRETERTLHSLNVKISELCDSVIRKRIELGLLQRIKNLSTILEAQMPYLDEWSALDEDYSTSLSEAIQSLLNASVQLPVGGNVRADTREIGEALNSAFKVVEIIAFHVQSFMPKAEEMDNLISELARVIGGERALIEECGDLSSKTYASQVEECSLRGQLIQLIRSSIGQPREE